ncbi:hypothetical protein EGM51_12420 [Verrucomicrobia bacterium S94]|nr:hypothetical protein EGM51_12420 [Verrucomicrobia bacterium S94]
MGSMVTYYMGRVAKGGQLDSEKIIQAILNPKPIEWWGKGWSFFDAQRYHIREIDFVFAKLSKFHPEGEVVIADPDAKKEAIQMEPNLRIASSTFIYIPKYSGIIFTTHPNHIKEHQFGYRFSHIISNTYDDFFVDCTVNLISDLRTFAEKLSKLKGIYKINAKVNPPNPLFGPLWKSLKDYVDSRNSDSMLVREQAGDDAPLNTDLPMHVQKVVSQINTVPYLPPEPLPIGDAAILMAADGYGEGLVQGYQEGRERVTIKTSETNRNFAFDRDPDPVDLFDEACAIFDRIEADRHMEHGE